MVDTFIPRGELYHTGRVDAGRPIDLSIPRNLIDNLGRPLRGVANHYNYAPDQRDQAIADYQEAKRLKLRPLLRDFSDLDSVRVLGK